jgi:hypothetical protein
MSAAQLAERSSGIERKLLTRGIEWGAAILRAAFASNQLPSTAFMET